MNANYRSRKSNNGGGTEDNEVSKDVQVIDLWSAFQFLGCRFHGLGLYSPPSERLRFLFADGSIICVHWRNGCSTFRRDRNSELETVVTALLDQIEISINWIVIGVQTSERSPPFESNDRTSGRVCVLRVQSPNSDFQHQWFSVPMSG